MASTKHGQKHRLYNFWAKWCPLPKLFGIKPKMCTFKADDNSSKKNETDSDNEAMAVGKIEDVETTKEDKVEEIKDPKESPEKEK
jgi:hypothetical protein